MADPKAPWRDAKDLLKMALVDHEGIEIVVSYIKVAPNFEAPRHQHPGQEFGYVQEGAVTVKVKGQPELPRKAGEVFTIPPRTIHTIMGSSTPSVMVVFRVHPKNAPLTVPEDPAAGKVLNT